MYKLIKTPSIGDPNDLFTIKVSLPDDASGSNLAEAFKAFMLACTFQPRTVNEVFNNEEIDDEA